MSKPPPAGRFRVSEETALTQGVLALGRAGHRIAASGVIKIPQFLALEIGLDRRRAISANLLNSECPRLEDEPVDPTKHAAVLAELRPLKRGRATIGVNENRVDCPHVTQPAHSL